MSTSQDSLAAQIKGQINLPDLIGKKVKLRRSGNSYVGLCPFHNERSPSFHVYSLDDSNRYACFSCGAKGDCFDWLDFSEGLDFPAALQLLGQTVGIEVPDFSATQTEDSPAVAKQRSDLEEQHQRYVQFYHTRHGEEARNYLLSRGLRDETIEQFGLGLCPPRVQGAEERNFAGRLMVPLRDELGQLVGFAGRTLIPGQKPKYINSPQSDLFDKGTLLYGLYAAKRHIRRTGSVLVMEGYTDVQMAVQCGYGHSVATMGTALTAPQAQKLLALKGHIILCLDGDSAGQIASERGFKQLRSQGREAISHTYVAVMPTGMDPGDVLSQDPDMFERLVSTPLPVVSFLIERWAKDVQDMSAPARGAIATRLAPLVREVADPIERDVYIGELATALRVSESAVRAAILNTKEEPVSPRSTVQPVRDTPKVVVPTNVIDHDILLLGLLASRPALSLRNMALRDGISFDDDTKSQALLTLLRALPGVQANTSAQEFISTCDCTEVQELLMSAFTLVTEVFPLVLHDDAIWKAELETLLTRKRRASNEYRRLQALLSLPQAIESGNEALASALVAEIRQCSQFN